jgi:hypothetical protein
MQICDCRQRMEMCEVRGMMGQIVRQGGLDAGALVALQQRLETLQATLTGNQLSEKARKNATKYHKVRG